MTQRAVASLVLLLLSAMPAFAGDPAAGEQVFKRNCTICHAVGPGAANKTGPQLNGIIGRKAGSAPVYNYSGANKSSGIAWNEAIFTKYIANPKGVVPGTKMTFPGLKNEGDIGDLVAYLQQFRPDGQPVK